MRYNTKKLDARRDKVVRCLREMVHDTLPDIVIKDAVENLMRFFTELRSFDEMEEEGVSTIEIRTNYRDAILYYKEKALELRRRLAGYNDFRKYLEEGE